MSKKENDASAPVGVDVNGKKVVRIRRLIEHKMVDSWQNVPHFL